MRVLLLTPPMTQLNTPYPATAYLTGFLRARSVDAVQADPAIELVCRLFSRKGLLRARDALDPETSSAPVRSFLAQSDRYIATVDSVIRFLQGKDPTLALRIASREFMPEGPRFRERAEGTMRGYVGEGRFTDDPLNTFGGAGVVEIPNLQKLLHFICERGFEHHVAANLSTVASAVQEATTRYLGWDMYYHGHDHGA